MSTAFRSLHFPERLPIIVEMITRLGSGANEGGQQPSEMEYSANPKTPCANMAPSTKFSRKFLAKRAAITTSLTETGSQTESDVSYRKQRTDDFLTGTRTASWRTEFSASGEPFRRAFPTAFSSKKRQQLHAAPERDTCAPPSADIQNLCGTIIIWGTARSHGTAAII